MPYPLRALRCPLWRMLAIRYQRDPWSGEGARRHGGRWNAPGQAALYLGTDHATAIADLTDGQGRAADERIAQALAAPWKAIAGIEGGLPPSWALAQELIAIGAEGARVPSAQNPGGTALVLWRWHRADEMGEGESGEGAALELLDPDHVLTPHP